MKAIIYLFLLTLSSSICAQTGIIAAKSHHASSEDYISEEDHFGQVYIPPKQTVDTVIYLGPGVIVEIGTRYDLFPDVRTRFVDTIHRSSIHKNTLPELKREYPTYTVFVGFETQTTNSHFDGMKRNGFSGILICGLLLLLCSNIFLKMTHSKQNS